MTVLVALSDDGDRADITRALEGRSLRVLEASTGEGALRALREAEDPAPRLALLDQDLAGLSGIHVLGKMRLETAARGCEALLALSPKDFERYKDPALQAGALGIVVNIYSRHYAFI